MLTESGCRARRERLWTLLPDECRWAVVTSPEHLIYLANFHPSPFVFNSQNARGMLLLGRDGAATLVADNVQQPFVDASHVTERVTPVWYRCVESAGDRAALLVDAMLRRLSTLGPPSLAIEPATCPAGLLDGLRQARPDVQCPDLTEPLRALRRRKDPDELALIRRSLAAATAALRAGMDGIRPGMSELEAHRLVLDAAGRAAGEPVELYGDFVSGPRCEQVGGPPTGRVIEQGDLVLLDFSVVLSGYRGDFCNTFVCGGEPTPRQQELFAACLAAVSAGEQALRAGVLCRDVHAAARGALAERGLAKHFPHHTGHGVGLGHPEPPYLVPESDETLLAGDVVTLEPGVYLPGDAGMRYERCYLITDSGCERLSDHPLSIRAN